MLCLQWSGRNIKSDCDTKVQGLSIFNILHLKEMPNLTAGAQEISRHSGNFYHQDLKVKQDVDCCDGISVSPGSCVAEQSSDSRLQGLQRSTIKTSSVSHRVGSALVFHNKNMAPHLGGLPDSPA